MVSKNQNNHSLTNVFYIIVLVTTI